MSEPQDRPDPLETLPEDKSWPKAGFGGPDSGRYQVRISERPVQRPIPSIEKFLEFPFKPLSLKATSGFYNRLVASSLRRPEEFDKALEEHIDLMSSGALEAEYVKTKVAV